MNDTPDQKPDISVLLRPSSGPASDPGDRRMGGGEGMDRQRERRFWTMRRTLQLAGAVVLVALLGYALWTTTGGRKLNVDTERLTVSTVRFEPFQERIAITGNVLPRTTVYLDAVEGGRIEEIYVQEGAMVEDHEPILRLSNSTLQLSLLNTESQRLEQISQLEQTRFQIEEGNLTRRQQLTDMDYNILRLRRDLERNQDLYEKRVISEREFQTVKDEYEYWQRRRDLTQQSFKQDSLRQALQVERMVLAVERMDANFEVMQEQLENLTVRAPLAGQLTALNAELGEMKGAGFRFGQVDVLDGFKVRAGIDEYYINRVVRGQRATTQPIAGVEYAMEVTRVYPEVRDGRFEVDLTFLGETPPDIRRGQTIRLGLEMSDLGEALTLARGGFYQSTGGGWVYVLDPSGDFAVKRVVRLGRQNPLVYEVLEGLEAGEQVVTSSYDTFGDVDRLVLQ
ncbi:MAG: HlyD family efflux transporter periplasmic adaptor subunit [Rhodothermales bacterium]